MSDSRQVDIDRLNRQASDCDDVAQNSGDLNSSFTAQASPFVSQQVWGPDGYGDKIWGGDSGLHAQMQGLSEATSNVQETFGGAAGLAQTIRDAAKQLGVTDILSAIVTDIESGQG